MIIRKAKYTFFGKLKQIKVDYYMLNEEFFINFSDT
jgi:hypothetical protein